MLRRSELRAREGILGLVIPEPVFAGLEAADDRVPRDLRVRGRVLRRRAVAAPDVAALRAPAQVDPPAAARVALDAARPARWHRRVDAGNLAHSALLLRSDRNPPPQPRLPGHHLSSLLPLLLLHPHPPPHAPPH